MFNYVSDVDHVARYSRRGQGLIEEPSGGSHERLSAKVLFMAWLLPNSYYSSASSAYPEHGLGRPLPKITRPAVGGSFFEVGQRGALRNQRSRRIVSLFSSCHLE